MACSIIWSPESLDDIEAVAEYIARDSQYYADSTVQKIFDAVTPLKDHPKIGRVVPEFNQDHIREIFVFQYRIIYEISGKVISILTVIHGRRIIDQM